MSKIKELSEPVAYILHKYGCLEPDDCEEYNELVLIEDADKEELERYIKHNHAIPLFSESSIKEKDEIIAKLEKQILAMRNCWNCRHQTMGIRECKTCDNLNNWQMKG